MLFFVLIFLAVLLESTVLSAPLTMAAILIFALYARSTEVFAIAFGAGILLDLMLLRTLGATAIFFLIFTVLILLYQKKYEIKSYPFVLFASFIGSYLYLHILNGSGGLVMSAAVSVLAVILFVGSSMMRSKGQRKKI